MNVKFIQALCDQVWQHLLQTATLVLTVIIKSSINYILLRMFNFSLIIWSYSYYYYKKIQYNIFDDFNVVND